MDYKKHYEDRNALITKLDNLEITKSEFIELNIKLYDKKPTNIVPRVFVSVEQGLYYYQYYNSMAKYHQKLSFEQYNSDTIKHLTNKYKSDEFYECKEQTINVFLNYIERNKVSNIRAYYVQTKSPKLKGLIEIVLLDYEKAILHSLNASNIGILKRMGVFSNECKKSIIEEYINKKYY